VLGKPVLPDDARRWPCHPSSIPNGIFRLGYDSWQNWRMPNEQKITLGQMRQSGLPWLQVCCGDHKCAHSVVIDADCWPESLRLSDLEALFVCTVCGHRGADVRPRFEHTRTGNRRMKDAS
jgi:hypothetical protein